MPLELGHTFADESLLKAALTHPSVAKKTAEARAYERLEFVGDRVLGLVIAAWLHSQFPNAPEGELARRYATLVRAETLYKIAESVGLGDALKRARDKSEGTRGQKNIMADALEAVIGAMYLDGGLKTAEKFIRKHFATLVVADVTAANDPKTALQEWAQARKLPVPKYEVTSRSGPAHAPAFEVSVTVGKNKPVTASGKSKQAAEKAAAEKLLERVTSEKA